MLSKYITINPLRAKSLRHNSVPAKKQISPSPSEIKWQLNYKDTKINKNPFVTPNNKSCMNKRCRLENWGFYVYVITGQCCSTEMEFACEKAANLEQETKATKIVTYHLFPLASSFCANLRFISIIIIIILIMTTSYISFLSTLFINFWLFLCSCKIKWLYKLKEGNVIVLVKNHFYWIVATCIRRC